MIVKRQIELIKRRIRPHTKIRANWQWLSKKEEWLEALEGVKKHPNKRILISTMTGSNWACSSFESLLGVALTLQGHKVTYLLCDGVLDACQECDFQWLSPEDLTKFGPQKKLCATCFTPASEMLSQTKLSVIILSDFLDGYDENIAKQRYSHTSQSEAGVLRYFAKGDASDEIWYNSVSDRFISGYLKSRYAVEKMIDIHNFDCVIGHHGIYVPQGAVVEAFKRRDLGVVTWTRSYKRGSFIFSHDDSYHYTMPNEERSDFHVQISEKKKKLVNEYFELRKTGGDDWITFYPPSKGLRTANEKKSDYEYTFGLFSNVNWDAQVHFQKSPFKSQTEWIFATLDHFIDNPRMRLIIRTHPAELRGSVPSRQPLSQIISDRYTSLPNNIEVLEPGDKRTSYDVAKEIDAALVFGSKIAVELACAGLNVVVAGDCWGKNKGFTIDVVSKSHYASILQDPTAFYLPKKDLVNNAFAYAYYLYFERAIPISIAKPAKWFGLYEISCDDLEEIRNCDGLNTVIKAIEKKLVFVQKDQIC